MENKITDTDLMYAMLNDLETKFYTFGSYSEYNDLDVRNLKNQIVEAINKKDGE